MVANYFQKYKDLPISKKIKIVICGITVIGAMSIAGAGLYVPLIMKDILQVEYKLSDADATAKATVYKVWFA